VPRRPAALATLAILTTTGPLISRVFEGAVRRVQRVRALDMDCLTADDEVLIARTVPLLMPGRRRGVFLFGDALRGGAQRRGDRARARRRRPSHA